MEKIKEVRKYTYDKEGNLNGVIDTEGPMFLSALIKVGTFKQKTLQFITKGDGVEHYKDFIKENIKKGDLAIAEKKQEQERLSHLPKLLTEELQKKILELQAGMKVQFKQKYMKDVNRYCATEIRKKELSLQIAEIEYKLKQAKNDWEQIK